MTFPSKEEIEATIEALRQTAERAKGDPEYAREVLKCLEDRPLSTQPELTPLERSERYMESLGKAKNNEKEK